LRETYLAIYLNFTW